MLPGQWSNRSRSDSHSASCAVPVRIYQESRARSRHHQAGEGPSGRWRHEHEQDPAISGTRRPESLAHLPRLVGIYQDSGKHLVLGVPAGTDDEFRVFLAASGKLVVYQVGSPRDAPGAIRVFDSFDAMEPHVPAKLFEAAAIRKPYQYPEVPLEEAD